jgi:hypothetical protein
LDWINGVVIAALIGAFLLLLRPVRHLFPKTRWKSMVFCAVMVIVGSLPTAIRTGDAIQWGFAIYGIVMVIIALVIFRPRDQSHA